MSLHTCVRFLLVVFMFLNNKIEILLLNYQMSIKQMSLVNYSIYNPLFLRLILQA